VVSNDKKRATDQPQRQGEKRKLSKRTQTGQQSRGRFLLSRDILYAPAGIAIPRRARSYGVPVGDGQSVSLGRGVNVMVGVRVIVGVRAGMGGMPLYPACAFSKSHATLLVSTVGICFLGLSCVHRR
jgi:hypothetical protein